MAQTHGFERLREQEIPELKTTARLYRHVKTGAQLVSLANDDENKVFGITFRTPLTDSTGVAHILEHAVLCGSRRYPLKDPFVELAKGSLRTFLNAFTFPDKTCYPVASQNVQDFHNLATVYLDTVFHPLLKEHTFQEQGWHYELEDPEAPLIYKGVVFNEMKGAYGSPDSRLFRESVRSLFPDNTYGVDSGGDPRHIPDLTYAQFAEFHRTYYHPSNARLWFYGDDPEEDRLRIADSYLGEFDPLPVDSTVALQARWSEPRRLTRPYPADPEGADGKKAMVTVNWMLDEPTDPELALALPILNEILIGTPAAPLRKALIDSGLGEDIAGGGLLDYLRQAGFSVGLKGIAAEDAPKVEPLILQTLGQLADAGIDPETRAAALNTVEFRLRENNTGSFPRGLALMLASLDRWLHDDDPFAPLRFETPLSVIKARAGGEPYFENLIRRYFLENPHRSTVLLTPEAGMDRRETEEEAARLAQVRAGLASADVQAVIDGTRRLKQVQETPDAPEALASLPALKRDDLDRENKIIPRTEGEMSGVRTLYHDLFTNGLLYLDLGMDLHVLPGELLPYVPLFGKALLQIGTETEDFVRLTQRIGGRTGGIQRQILNAAVRETPTAASWLFLRGKATTAQAGDLLDILRDLLLTVRLDNRERFRQMALEEKARLEASLSPAGSSYVDSRLRARFHEASWAGEQMGGIAHLFFLRELVEAVEADWPGVLARLERVRSLLVTRGALLCNATLDAANWSAVAPRVGEFLSALPDTPVAPEPWNARGEAVSEGLTIPGQVNYVGKAADLYQTGYTLHGSSAAVLNYLRSTWLWDRVRKEGGAYGVSCGLDQRSGVFVFTSYRDPNLLGTLEVYDGSVRFLRGLALDEREVTRSIIGAIADIDRYQLPDARGFTSLVHWLTGETDTHRQRLRDELLGATLRDFHAFADALERMNDRALIAVLGSESAIGAANAARDGWLKIVKVL